MTYDTIDNDVTMPGATGAPLGRSDAAGNVFDAKSVSDAVTMAPGGGLSLGRIDQYELLRELGGGGFGSVYLARDTVAGIEVAVKGLPPMIRNNAEELERIRENFALVSRLHHPYIAAALHLQRANEVYYGDESIRQKLRVLPGDTLMVMEYAHGVTLSQWRRQFPGGIVPLELAIQIVWQVAQALDYAHEQHIIHRDVKPSNVMVETKPDGEIVARILDFGLAAEIRSSMGRVSREVRDTSGTRPYMAPEQWAGRKQGPATDQYALAAMFYELLTGEVPFASVFDTCDPIVMMTAVCNREVEFPEDCPRQIALRRALSKDPEQRFANCVEFIEVVAKSESVQGDNTRGGDKSDSDRQDVAARLRQSAQAIIEVDRLHSEVARLEDSCSDPRIHSSRMAMKSARMEMEAASGARCMELQEAAKVIFAEAKSVYDEHIAKMKLAQRRAQEKQRQELEERKRLEQAEIESYKARVEAVKREIQSECAEVSAYVKANPEYGDCLPVVREIVASVYEEVPADLPGVQERLEKLEMDLECIRGVISSHDVVVCACLNDVEVGQATMLYGGRRIALPVRIKRKHRLSNNEGYLLEYSRENRKYYGWFSPANMQPSEGQYAMVPLHKKPSIGEITEKTDKGVAYLLLLVSIEVSVLLSYIGGVCCKDGDKIIAQLGCAIFSFPVAFFGGCLWVLRRGMPRVVRDNNKDQYRMLQQSSFKESELLLDRRERSTLEVVKDFKLRNLGRCLWGLIVSLYCALHVVGIAALICSDKYNYDFGMSAWIGGIVLVAIPVFCVWYLRKEKWVVLIGYDAYKAKQGQVKGASKMGASGVD